MGPLVRPATEQCGKRSHERGSNQVDQPPSSNTPVLVLSFSDDVLATALVPHMVVVLVSLYLGFALLGFLSTKPSVRLKPDATYN